MSDFERKVRDAIISAAEGPPPGLIEAVRRRHRRHVRRAVAGYVGAVAAIAIAIVPVLDSLHGGQRSPSLARPGRSVSSAAPTSGPSAAPGTVLAGCDKANVGQVASSNLAPDWRGAATKAGPLSFVDVGGHSTISGSKNTGQKAVLYAMAAVITGVTPGATVVVRVAQAGQGHLRFLYGPADSLNAGTVYTMASGESGVTFVMCPQGGVASAAQPITDYYGGVLVDGARCVPVDVWPPQETKAIRINLGACH